MPGESYTLARRSPTARSRITNRPGSLPGVDQRTAAARRFRDLLASLAAEYAASSQLSAVELGAIRAAAAILLRCEQLQAAIVQGAKIDDDELIRLTSEARRLLNGLRKCSAAVPHIPLRDQLMAEAAEEVA